MQFSTLKVILYLGDCFINSIPELYDKNRQCGINPRCFWIKLKL